MIKDVTVSTRGGAETKKYIEALRRSNRSKQIKVGFFSTARYPDKQGTFVAAVAAWNNFGANLRMFGKYRVRLRARPFFSNAVRDSLKAVQKITKQVNPKTFEVTSKMARAIGAVVKHAVQEEIRNLKEPPNTAVTKLLKLKRRKKYAKLTLKRAKGIKTNPLIDTGTMRTAVTYKTKTTRQKRA